MIITIDGPTASGKSTVGRMLAQELGFYYLYSGLLYRALAYSLITHYNYDMALLAQPNEKDIATFLCPDVLRYEYLPTVGESVWCYGVNITGLLKSKEIDQAASVLSTSAHVRDCLLAMQHAIAKTHSVVVDGRDAGSVVFPDAAVKIFLTANNEQRARRWVADQRKRGVEITLEAALDQLQKRDERDAHRTIAPLQVPHGAVVIDNSDKDIMQTLHIIKKSIQEKREH